MSKTSDRVQALSLAIAERYEPLKDNLELFEGSYHGEHSELGWWEWMSEDWTEDECHWQARSIAEPEIAMRLLKELLLKHHGSIAGDTWSSEAQQWTEFSGHAGFRPFHGSSLELAIAEAFAKSVNLEVE